MNNAEQNRQIGHSEALAEESTMTKEEMLRTAQHDARREKFFSHFPFPFFLPRNAFTLAEVLITLGIIGVVAAMTIPTLMNSTQNKENETALKKMYANISNALNQVTQDNGGNPYQCFFDASAYSFAISECTTFWDEFLLKFSSGKKCIGGVASNCQPAYKNYAEVIADGGAGGNSSFSGLNTTTDKATYTLPDGSMILSYASNFGSYGLFIIDTNGFKKPNKWGYDVFMLSIVKDVDKLVITDNVSYPANNWFQTWLYEKGGKRINNILSGD